MAIIYLSISIHQLFEAVPWTPLVCPVGDQRLVKSGGYGRHAETPERIYSLWIPRVQCQICQL